MLQQFRNWDHCSFVTIFVLDLLQLVFVLEIFFDLTFKVLDYDAKCKTFTEMQLWFIEGLSNYFLCPGTLQFFCAWYWLFRLRRSWYFLHKGPNPASLDCSKLLKKDTVLPSNGNFLFFYVKTIVIVVTILWYS